MLNPKNPVAVAQQTVFVTIINTKEGMLGATIIFSYVNMSSGTTLP